MKAILLVFLILITVPVFITHAEKYYADINIDVKDTGILKFSGITNHPMLKGESGNYTSKKGEVWLINITLGNFSDYVYRITLPEKASVNYIRSNSRFRIETDGRLTIIGTGKTELSIIIQYTIKNQNIDYFPTAIAITSVLIIITAVLLIRKKKKAINVKYNETILTERQKMIVNMLEKGHVTQSYLEKNLSIPKSSLSRNIRSLERKGIIKKYKKGMSNVIELKKEE
ncbi:MAG: hypothetical protein J4473_05540 [Candidatus Aenigmarchaeota archaeon]|nr:hypothetical protein [Candidatus Aenigmarchaeota archaeon]